MSYDFVSLLDQNIKTIIGKEQKHHWKESFSGIKPILELQDQNGTILGQFQNDKKSHNEYTLFNSDKDIVLQLSVYGPSPKKVEIRDSEYDFLARVESKRLGKTSFFLRNSNDETILQGKGKSWKSNSLEVKDKKENIVAEWNPKIRGPWVLNLHDSIIDRILVLGFILGIITLSPYVFEATGVT